MTDSEAKNLTLKEAYSIELHAPEEYVIAKPYENLPPINANILINNTPFYAKFDKYKKKRKKK